MDSPHGRVFSARQWYMFRVEMLARSEKKACSEEKEKIAEREMIKAMLNECGERMTPEEKKRWSRKLMAMYVKDIQSNGASQGEGGGGL